MSRLRKSGPGQGSLARLGKLRKAAARQGFAVDQSGSESGALLISGRSNIRYLSGFTGSAGYLLVGPSSATLYTDGRYKTQARQQTTAADVVITERDPLPTIAEDIKRKRIRRLGFEENRARFAMYDWLRRTLRGRRLVALNGLVEGLRLIKSPDEIAKMRRSALLNARAFRQACRVVRPTWTEARFAAEIEYQMRTLGAEKPAFDTIVAGGLHSALPHGLPRRVPLEPNTLIVVDQGAILDGYTSDMTRMVCLGRVDSARRRLYRAVLEAQLAALDAVRAGVQAATVDRRARQVLRQFKLEKAFTHSAGHGLGLEIHESPRVGPGEKARLAAGMVITIEPGAYLDDLGGVRIEDTVVVTPNGCEIITPTSKRLLRL